MKRIAFLLTILFLTTAAETSLSAPLSTWSEDESFLDRQDRVRRDARLDSLTDEIQAGLTELTRHFIRGNATPLPPAVGLDFLRYRALTTGRKELAVTADGLAAAWFTLNLNKFMRHGLPVDPNAPEGPTRKNALVQAELLSVAASAYQAGGKEIFARAATRLAEDLILWSLPGLSGDGNPVTVLGWIGVDPDTLPGDPASTDERAGLAASLALAGAVLGKPDWTHAGARIAGTTHLSANAESLSAGDLGLGLHTRLEATMALGHFPGLHAVAAQLMDRAPGLEAPDSEAPAWVGLALARYAAWSHDEAATAAAWRWMDQCSADDASQQRNMVRFRARCAEAYGLDFLASPPPMAYIVANAEDPRGEALRIAALRAARPGRIISFNAPESESLLYPASDTGAIAYICSGELCAPPTGDPEQVRTLLETFALPTPRAGAKTGSSGSRP